MKEKLIEYDAHPEDCLEAFEDLLDEIGLELVERWEEPNVYISIKGKYQE